MQLHFTSFNVFVLIVFASTLVLSADRRPWYRSKEWAERKAEEKLKKERRIKWHKEEITRHERELNHIEWKHDGIAEEMINIPPGAAKQTEIKKKIYERRKSESSLRFQKLASKLLQKDSYGVSQAIQQNIVNAPSKHQRIQKDIARLKSENKHIPALERYHDDCYSSRLREIGRDRCGTSKALNEHKYWLKEIEDSDKKKALWKWKSFPCTKKRE
ncbi:uncharacterized protein FA14DRAFT_154773 [Meira miltonrushii]|uniref:Uncharacterized protein n=1 Tax=Meira miltonrushii TaxID=1280837 RepID=A0A316VE63_9BASI|nr:uncharacterized protein FA14DRAFT_154773 [Meira miltonrushii]PWN35358.1 hypothetical protein FA14DRAFT_154773 [Meira miltonrushii]